MNNFVLPPWKRIELGDPMLITDTVDSLRQELNAIYLKHAAPTNMAAFLRYETQSSLHRSDCIYLSPELSAQYTDRKAQLCPQPSTDGLVYFIGDLVMITKL